MNEFNSLERRASLYTMQGMQQATIHVAMFMELLAAQQAGNEKLANFYAERFPPDVRKAYDAWLTQKPFENPNADPHPFVPNLYEVRGTREAAEATDLDSSRRRHDAVHRGTDDRQLEAIGVELPGDVDVLGVAGPPAGDDRDVVEPIRPTTGLADPDLDFHP